MLTHRKQMRRLYIAPALVAMIALATYAAAATQVGTSVALPAIGQFSTTASGCDNSPGPFITMNGEISLGGLGVRMYFQNNVDGTHTYISTTTVDVVVLPAGQTITFAKQPPLGGVGGNPWIYLQLVASNGNSVTDPVLLGRCVQGFFSTTINFAIAALATADVVVNDCSNNGPSITLSGQVSLTGISARFIFTNNQIGTHTHIASTSVSVVIIPAGQSITFPKQPVLGGVGGNPWIYVQFLDSNGNPVGDKILLGRCVQLDQA